jgi:hypothetical protein
MRRLLIIAAVAVVGCMPAPADKPGPFDAEEPGLSTDALEAKRLEEVADHVFWKVPVSTAQVSDLVDEMRAEQDDAQFLIDDHFHVLLRHGADAQSAANGRHIEMNMTDYYRRPSRVRLLVKLKAKQDEEESRAR